MKNLWLEAMLWFYVIFPAVGFIIAFIFFELDPERNSCEYRLIVAALSFLVLFVNYKIMSLRCPLCNRSLHPLDKITEWKCSIFFFIIETRCRSCGYDLRGRNM